MKFNQKNPKPLKVLGRSNTSRIMLKIVQFCMHDNFQCPVVNHNCRHLQQREAHDCPFDNRVQDPLYSSDHTSLSFTSAVYSIHTLHTDIVINERGGSTSAGQKAWLPIIHHCLTKLNQPEPYKIINLVGSF